MENKDANTSIVVLAGINRMAPIGRKAIVTLHNIGGSVHQLAEELCRERTAIVMGQKP